MFPPLESQVIFLSKETPIVNKGMHELRRVVNAVIKQYGKPDVVRIEMARDLEMMSLVTGL
jgi:CRISPR/Cas system Type II protein with McrA/HNH and RuvC-like nuclease domain